MTDNSTYPAFPVPGDQQYQQMNGITRREYFAGQVLPSVVTAHMKDGMFPSQDLHPLFLLSITKTTMAIVDSMIAELNKRKQP